MKAIDFAPRKTAHLLDFSATELGLISEALRMAQQLLLEESTRVNIVYPNSPMVERFRKDAESMADLLERVEA